MCGIAGIFGNADAVTLDVMLECLVHRGPDEWGTYIDEANSVVLGTRRLSIVDLKEGAQPMWNEEETICVSFNGEIYNHERLRSNLERRGHEFATRCDTEVLVHLWEEFGVEMVTRLSGMFAFAIWDENRDQVFLARDRLGIKPLYYAHQEGNILWASELPALLRAGVSRDVDRTALNEYFALSHTTAPRTIIASIKKLPPATTATIDDSGISTKRYWTLKPVSTDFKSLNDITKSVRSDLETAVERRLMGDVSVGAFLSGGLDSSAVVGLMSKKTDENICTYSVEFADPKYDETQFSNAIAAEFGTEHTVISTDLSDLNVFERTVSKMNEPIADPAILPTALLSSEAANNLKVVLTGTGGDELFAGYDGSWNMIAEHLNKFGNFPTQMFSAAGALSKVSPLFRGHLNYFYSLVEDSNAIVNFLDGGFTRQNRSLDLLKFDSDEFISSPECLVRNHFNARDSSPEDHIYQFLINAHLPDRLLQKVDNATMNASLEARVPFLDSDLVETAMSIPYSVKTDGNYKPILRKAVEDFVPSMVLKRNKMGFSVPVTEWIASRPDPFERWLSEEKIKKTPYLNYDSVWRLYAEHYRGHDSHTKMLLRAFVYVAWYHTVMAQTDSILA